MTRRISAKQTETWQLPAIFHDTDACSAQQFRSTTTGWRCAKDRTEYYRARLSGSARLGPDDSGRRKVHDILQNPEEFIGPQSAGTVRSGELTEHVGVDDTLTET